jgi:hypothetical protein
MRGFFNRHLFELGAGAGALLILATPYAAHASERAPRHSAWHLEANGDWNCPAPASRCFVADIPRKESSK